MAFQLYSNRELEFIELDANYGSPFLLIPKADWYWLVDVKFCAWAYRIVNRAREAGQLTPEISQRFADLRTYARERFGDECNAVPEMAAKAVELTPIPDEFFRDGFRAFESVPMWPSFENDKRKWHNFEADRIHNQNIGEWIEERRRERAAEESGSGQPSRDAAEGAGGPSTITSLDSKRKIVKSKTQKPKAPDSPSLFGE